MASQKLSSLPSLRKQQLLSEFSGLKQACPTGVFVTLTPGEPTLWSAVLFIRDGPYAPAVLRFQIAFPASYPQLPPIIIFATDIFHPLITPLTTYMYTTDIQDNGTVSATDDERLPPGGFSLRHGFPQWFGRGRRTTVGSPGPRSNGAMSPVSPNEGTQPPTPMSPYFATPGAPIPQPLVQRDTSMYSILKYIKSTFDNAEVLDTVPIDAAGNPGAWQAWRAHRRKLGKLPDEKRPGAPQTPVKEIDEPLPQIMSPKKPPTTPTKHSSPSKFASPSKNKALPATPRKPGEWNWDGVWEDRVKKGISTSLSEPVLYGGATATDELVRFLAMDETEIESIKDNLRRTLEGSA